MKRTVSKGFLASLIVCVAALVAGVVLLFTVGFHTEDQTRTTLVVRYDNYVTLNTKLRDEIRSYCKDVVSGQTTYSESALGGEIVITVANAETASSAAAAIREHLTTTYPDGEFNVACYTETVAPSTTFVWRTAIVSGVLLAGAFVYTWIRHRFSFALAQGIGNVAAIVLTLALTLVCRIPVGEVTAVSLLGAQLLVTVMSFVYFNVAKTSFVKTKELSAGESVDAAFALAKKPLGVLFTVVSVALVVACAGWLGYALGLLTVPAALVSAAFASCLVVPSCLAKMKVSTDVADRKKEHYAYKG